MKSENYLQLGTGELISKEKCEELKKNFADNVLLHWDEFEKSFTDNDRFILIGEMNWEYDK